MWNITYPILIETCRYLSDPSHIVILDQLARGIIPIGYEGDIDHQYVYYKNIHYKYVDKDAPIIAKNLQNIWKEIPLIEISAPLKKIEKPEFDVMFYKFAKKKRWSFYKIRRYRVYIAFKMISASYTPRLTTIRSLRLKR